MAIQTQRFSSRLTTLMTMAGLAIGLGNVWRFPYMMGQHGGSAFLLVYAVFMLALAAPALAAEFAMGRQSRRGPLTAFQAAFGPRLGLLVGLLALLAAFMATCYYSIIIANVFYSAWFSALQGFSDTSLSAYETGLAQEGVQYIIALLVVLSSAVVVSRGLQKGIERANRILMPVFGLAALYMVIMTLRLEGATDKLWEFLQPDFSRAGPSIWFAAMGQACFSVGLSGTLGVMYGTYLRRDAALIPTAAGTCLMDLAAAFMAALFVVPAVLVFGLDLAAGPGLLFDTLPKLFASMPGGRWLAPLFLTAWAMVAMLTLIAALDTVTGALADAASPGNGGGEGVEDGPEESAGSRNRWLRLVTGAACAVILPIAFNPHWIGTLDLIFGSGMFMMGALMAVLAIGWGLGKTALPEQLSVSFPPMLGRLMSFWIRFVVPTALIVILGGFILSSVSQ